MKKCQWIGYSHWTIDSGVGGREVEKRRGSIRRPSYILKTCSFLTTLMRVISEHWFPKRPPKFWEDSHLDLQGYKLVVQDLTLRTVRTSIVDATRLVHVDKTNVMKTGFEFGRKTKRNWWVYNVESFVWVYICLWVVAILRIWLL